MKVYDIYDKGALIGKFKATLVVPSRTEAGQQTIDLGAEKYTFEGEERDIMICAGNWIIQPEILFSHSCEVRYENSEEAINQGFTSLGINNIMFEVRKPQ